MKLTRLIPAFAVAATLTLTACGSGSDEATPELDPTKLTIYSAQHKNLVDAWVKAMNDAGHDGQAMLDDARAMLAAGAK